MGKQNGCTQKHDDLRILRSNIYKTRRILYYIEPSKQKLEAFYDGIIPEKTYGI